MNSANIHGSDERRKLRIFVSSPGDVGVERVIADRVIRRLQREYRNSIDIEPILWENLPLTPTATFQDGINALLEDAPIDVAIFILGARLGSSPGRNYVRADGTPYSSGTEYEFDMMMEAYCRSGRPQILFYKKEIHERQVLSGKDFSEAENIINQFKAVNKFVEEHFYDKDKGAYVAYHLLDDKSVGFEQRLEAHLREIIEKLLPSKDAPRWHGNPYKGLLSFGIDDEAIFFGRVNALNELERELFSRCASESPEFPLVIVSGESGAGKSSFVKAGLLPDLLRTTIFPKSRVEYRIATPAQWGSCSCYGLWRLIQEILPDLPDLPKQTFSDEQFAVTISTLLKNTMQKRVESTGLCTVPLLVVDQFEEIFTHADIAEDERKRFALLLLALQKSARSLVILTIRNDFYHSLTDSDEWLSVKKNALLYDLPRMSVDEYRQVITSPVDLAGYRWERDERGVQRLDEAILDVALTERIPLPLLEFALADIVERNGDDKTLTFATYKAIGGIGGAIQKRADELFQSMSSDEKTTFFRLLGCLVTISTTGGKCVRAEVAVKDVMADAVQRKVVDLFVANRLFAISSNGSGSATVTVAHEALISQWKVIQDWIERERQLIQARRDCESAMVKWENNNCVKELLLSSSTDLAQAEDLLLCWGVILPERLKKYIKFSFKRKYRSRAWWTLGASAFSALITLFVVLMGLYFLSNPLRYISFAEDSASIVRLYCLCMVGGISLLCAGTCVLLYSAIHRFKGCPKLLRGRADTIVYGMGLVFSCLGGGLGLWASVVMNSSLGFQPTVQQVVGNTVPACILLFVFIQSLSNVWYVKHRKSGLVAFGYRSSVFSRILFLARFLAVSVFVGILIYLLIYSLKDNFVNRERYDELLERYFNADHSFETCDWITNELNAQRDKDTRAFPSDKETSLFYILQLVRGCPEEVLNDRLGIWRLQRQDKDKVETLMFDCHVAIGDIASALDSIHNNDHVNGYKKIRYALLVNRTEAARAYLEKLVRPDEKTVTDVTLGYAHGLLLCNNATNDAESLYNLVLGDKTLRRKMEGDFTILKRFPEYRNTIETVEHDLNLKPVPVSEGTGDAVDIPWLDGVWQWQKDVAVRVDMTIDSTRRINCKSDDYDLARDKISARRLYRMRIKPENDAWLLELYNTLDGYFVVCLMRKIDDSTIEISILYSDEEAEKGQKRIYKRQPKRGENQSGEAWEK